MALQKVQTNPNFLPPKKSLVPDQVPDMLTEEYNRKVICYRNNYLNYIPDSEDLTKKDSKQRYNQYLIQSTIPECVHYKLISMTRVILPDKSPLPMFLDKDNKLDPNVKSALIARVSVTIENENSHRKGILGQYENECSYTLGRLLYPIPNVIYDSNGNIIDCKFMGARPVFYYPDTKQQVDKIQKVFGEVNKDKLYIIEANYLGNVKNSYLIPNQEEWLDTKPEELSALVQSNKKGLLGQRKGGLDLYKQYQKLTEKLMSEGIPESKFADLKKEDILELLEKKQLKSIPLRK